MQTPSKMVWCGLHLHELCDEELRTFDFEVRLIRAAVAHDHGEEVAARHDEDIAELAAHMAERGLTQEPLPPLEENFLIGKLRLRLDS